MIKGKEHWIGMGTGSSPVQARAAPQVWQCTAPGLFPWDEDSLRFDEKHDAMQLALFISQQVSVPTPSA